MAISVLNVNRREGGVVDVAETEDVVIAAENIERGKLFAVTALEKRPWPKGWAPDNVIRSVDDTKDMVLISPVVKGELILKSKLVDKKAGALDVLISPNKRAYTMMASRVATNVAGFVVPGSYVDVLLNMKGGGRGDMTGGGSTTTLLQAIKVLAVDQRVDPATVEKIDAKSLSSVTVEVTPDQVNMLDLGQNQGTLSLSLRNPGDLLDVNTAPATVNKMRFHEEAPTGVMDGDSPPPPQLAVAAPPSTTRQEPETRSLVVWRGPQRARVWLTEMDGLQ